MSDGPHRSLPIKPKWRSVAERAHNTAFELDEISTAMMPALARDCQDEMSPHFLDRLRSLCEPQQPTLFKDSIRVQVETLRPDAGHGLGRRVLDNVVRLSKQKEVDVFTAVEAVERAIAERLVKSNRQIEELLRRNPSVSHINNVRARLEQAAAMVPIHTLARQQLKLEDRPVRSSAKRDGLDDGPRIK